MNMKKTLEFVIQIQAPRERVWETMIAPATYEQWSAEFCAGSHFKGSWAQGERIQFLTPDGDGMSSVIQENRPYELISIRHLGAINAGVEDFTSEKVLSWAPAYETYSFTDVPGGTELRVTMDTILEYEDFIREAFPKALQRLKALCEGGDQ